MASLMLTGRTFLGKSPALLVGQENIHIITQTNLMPTAAIHTPGGPCLISFAPEAITLSSCPFCMAGFGSYTFNITQFQYVCFVLFWFGLVCFGLVCFGLVWFLFCFSETGFLSVALAVLELTL